MVANVAADLLKSLEEGRVEVLPALSPSGANNGIGVESSEMPFYFDTFSNNFSMEYNQRLARGTKNYSVDAPEVRVKMTNTRRQYPLPSL